VNIAFNLLTILYIKFLTHLADENILYLHLSDGLNMKLNTLKKREEFVSLRSTGELIVTKSVVMQFKKIDDNNINFSKYQDSPKFGFTASKKVGGAVFRNKSKRRLKEVVRFLLKTNPNLFKSNYSYNFIARYSTINRPFDALIKDVKYSLHQVN
jgi:ribonuclease P protein component